MPKTEEMRSLPRPLVALLAGVVVFAAAWMLVLKPSSSESSSSTPAPAAPAPAVTHAATPPATKPASKPASKPAVTAATKPAATPASKAAAHAARTHPTTAKPQDSLAAFNAALSAHKVLVALFYNPAASDDKSVLKELDGVDTHGGKVVTFAVPVSQITQYSAVTSGEVPISAAPTLVVIDAKRQATTILGFADSFEIAQRVDQALAAH
jgi:hypothetical protein